MDSQLPQPVAVVLNLYLDEVEARLPGFLSGFYLHGSIALDAFDPTFSDVDFIAVHSRRVTDDDIATLDAIHQQVARHYPHPPMQGSYLQAHDLGRADLPACPHYSDGVLHAQQQNAENEVTWWLLKKRGVTLLGRPAHMLDFSPDWARVIAYIRENINGYWGRYTREPMRIVQLLFDKGVQWAVLGVLRQYYSFETGEITSKLGAGSYALQHLPKRWHRIVQEAVNIRRQRKPSLYRSPLLRAVDAFAFLRFIIGWCNSTTAPTRRTD